MENFKNYIRDIDFFGYVPKIEVNQKKKHKTLFGSFISFVMIIIILTILYYWCLELISRSRQRISHTVFKDEKPSKIKFDTTNFMMTLGVTFGDDTFVIDESVYNLKLLQQTMNRSGDGKFSKSTVPFEIVRCSDMNITLIPDYFKRENLDNLHCVKNMTTFATGEYGDDEYVWLEFSFHRCNSTLGTCNNETETLLNGAYVSVFMTDTSIVQSDVNNPISKFGKNLYNLMTLFKYKESNVYFKNIEIISDYGWLWSFTEKLKSFSYETTEDLWDYRSTSDIFFKLNLRASNKREEYERGFTKVQDLVSDIGGFIKMMMIVGKFIVHSYSELSFTDYITKFFINEHSDVENELNINRTDNNSNNSSNNSIVPINSIDTSQLISNYSKKKEIQYMSFCSKAYNLFFCDLCKTKKMKDQMRRMNNSMDKIKCKLDWVSLVKNQNEYESMKMFFLTTQQNDLFSLIFHNPENEIKESLYKHKFPINKISESISQRIKESYKNLLCSVDVDPKSKIILDMLNDTIKSL